MDKLLDKKHEEWLEARHQKQTHCLMQGKRCAECNGISEYDEDDKCPYWKTK